MSNNVIKSTESIVSCSDNGQHPLIYISLKNGSGQCQYCGQQFKHIDIASDQEDKIAA